MKSKAKKNIIKVSLIVVSVAGAVLGIVLLQKLLSPPVLKELPNQYLADLQQRNEQLNDTTQLEYRYQQQLDRIRLMQEKKLITDEEARNKKDTFLLNYADQFFVWCTSEFSKSTWADATLQFMGDRINNLAQGGLQVSSHEKLQKVKKVLAAYKDITTNWPNRKIEKYSDHQHYADKKEEYFKDDYVKTCLTTCNRTHNILDGLYETDKDKHKSHVQTLINNLCKNPTLANYGNLKNRKQEVSSAIDDYGNWNDVNGKADLRKSLDNKWDGDDNYNSVMNVLTCKFWNDWSSKDRTDYEFNSVFYYRDCRERHYHDLIDM